MRIRYVDSYVDAPKSAEFILRRDSGSGWRLERYVINQFNEPEVNVLKEFYNRPEKPMTLKATFPEMGRKTLWIEK